MSATPLYVAVDVGCIECGEESAVLGIFTDEARATEVCNAAEEKQQADWHGQHRFEVFTIVAIDTTPATAKVAS